MIPILKEFDYIKMEREDTPNGRMYISPSGQRLPSVTTILAATKDMTGLNAWREYVGESKANEILKDSSAVGTLLHARLEDYIMGIAENTKTNHIHKMAKIMADRIIKDGLSTLEAVHGIEVGLYCEGLYAGTTDLIAVIDGQIVIGDYKNSKKIKEEKYLEDYYEQLVAYSVAHNEMYSTDIKKGVIFMVTRPNEKTKDINDIEYKTFVLEDEKFEKYKKKWFERVAAYYEKN